MGIRCEGLDENALRLIRDRQSKASHNA